MAQKKPGKPRHGAKLKTGCNISLNPDIVTQLDAIALSKGVKRSALISQIIEEYLGALR